MECLFTLLIELITTYAGCHHNFCEFTSLIQSAVLWLPDDGTLLIVAYFLFLGMNSIWQFCGNTDIYLLDQIMKQRYSQSDIVLDAGCGKGRNLHWFLMNEIAVYGIDMEHETIELLRLQYPSLPAERLTTGDIEVLPYQDDFFDHVISSAVLHFANSQQQFNTMLAEMGRVLKPGGTMFIRMTSDIGIEQSVIHLGDGVYSIPDGSQRFLLTRDLLKKVLADHPLSLIEPVKTVNVQDLRCMTTLVLQKNGGL